VNQGGFTGNQGLNALINLIGQNNHAQVPKSPSVPAQPQQALQLLAGMAVAAATQNNLRLPVAQTMAPAATQNNVINSGSFVGQTMTPAATQNNVIKSELSLGQTTTPAAKQNNVIKSGLFVGQTVTPAAPKSNMVNPVLSVAHSRGSCTGVDESVCSTTMNKVNGTASACAPSFQAKFMKCPAKAMPASHASALLSVPATVVHGGELICSDAECRNIGIKFLYCLQCARPCPKRNFSNKHTHGNSQVTHVNTSGAGYSYGQHYASKISGRTVVTHTSGSLNGADVDSEHRSLAQVSSKQLSPQGASVSRSTKRIAVSATNNKLERKDEWESLLSERPSGDASPEAIEEWLSKILAVSKTNRVIDNVYIRSLASTLGQEASNSNKQESGRKRKSEESGRGSSSSSSLTMDDLVPVKIERDSNGAAV
jgi:hypothetical protein